MNPDWTHHLETRITAPFAPWTSPDVHVATAPTLALAAEDASYTDGVLTFRLLLRYALPEALYQAYRVPTWAIHLVIERPETSQAACLAVKDPYAEYAPLDGPNLREEPPPPEPEGVFAGESLAIALAVPLPDRQRGPHIYVTAHLRDLASNTLAIDADATVVTSIGGSRP